MQLREYNSGDLDSLFELDEACFAAPFRFSRRAMQRFAEARNSLTVIAEDLAGDGRTLAGFCIAHVESSRDGRAAYVVTLDVAEPYRRQRLAAQMMESIEQQAMEAGCVAMELHVSTENSGAIGFYEREGYSRSHLVHGFYGEGWNAYVYQKRLDGVAMKRRQWESVLRTT